VWRGGDFSSVLLREFWAFPLDRRDVQELAVVKGTTAWMSGGVETLYYARGVLAHFYRIFFDMDLRLGASVGDYLWQLPVIAVVYSVEGLAILFVLRKISKERTALLLLFLIAPSHRPLGRICSSVAIGL